MDQCKKCGSNNVVLVEYEMIHPDHFDGISEIKCLDCGARIGRWSGKELQEGEFEPKGGVRK